MKYLAKFVLSVGLLTVSASLAQAQILIVTVTGVITSSAFFDSSVVNGVTPYTATFTIDEAAAGIVAASNQNNYVGISETEQFGDYSLTQSTSVEAAIFHSGAFGFDLGAASAGNVDPTSDIQLKGVTSDISPTGTLADLKNFSTADLAKLNVADLLINGGAVPNVSPFSFVQGSVVSYSAAEVPEPSTYAMLISGLALLLWSMRYRGGGASLKARTT